MIKYFIIIFTSFISTTYVLRAATAEEIFVKNGSLTIGIVSAVPGESGQILELMESLAVQASQQFVDKELIEIVPQAVLNEFNITHPSVKTGLVIKCAHYRKGKKS